MSVTLQYIASSGNVYDLKADGIRTKTANYHKWSWGVNGTTLQYGTRISDFKRSAATYSTQLILDGTYTERKTMLESLHDDFELDVRNMTPGKVVWGDYYIKCYVSDSSTFPDENDLWTDNEVVFYCPYPFWVKEETKSFLPQEAPEDQTYLDYEYDYEYDYYYGTPGIAIWQTDFPFTSDFRMVVYGAATDPSVTVNGYAYSFTDTLDATDYVVIDSRENTIVKYLANGTTSNLFDARNKENSIFEPMPAGTLTFNWSGTFGFDLTLYEERSEPRWNT